MAVLMGPVEVRQTFHEWPAKMCLAVCLMESGDCQLVVFHQDEAGVFPRRLQSHLHLPGDELCFFPAVPGYPSRTLLYSDERRLVALVAEAPEIVEEASDYAVNYAFALEEGLDPAVFLGVEGGGAVERGGGVERGRAPMRHDHAKAARDPAAFVSRRGKLSAPVAVAAQPPKGGRVRKALLPGFMQRTTPAQPGPGFRSARELSLTEMPPELCDVRPEENGWVLISRVDVGGADIRISDPDMIFLRDDRSVLAIRLEPPWDMGSPLPGRIWVRSRGMPSSLRAALAKGAGLAEMTGTGAFLYLRMDPALSERAPAEEPAAPEAVEMRSQDPAPEVVPVVPQRRARRFYRRGLLALTGIAAALVLVQIGLQLGGMGDPGTLGAEAPIDWERFRSAWQAARAG